MEPYPQRKGFARLNEEHRKLEGGLRSVIIKTIAEVAAHAMNELAEQEETLLTRSFISHGTIDLGAGQRIVVTIELVLPDAEPAEPMIRSVL